MPELYAEPHRRLQDRHGTRALADLLEHAIVHDVLSEQDRAFIAAQDMLFLSTVDPQGRPTVSYKGGAKGFVRIEGNSLVFPCYDGNGMFYSMGNLSAQSQVGLLFIDFATPNRLRIQGTASIEEVPQGGPPGALFLVRILPALIFPNCGRYIHKVGHQAGQATVSPHVPAGDGSQPVAAWKRIDIVNQALPERDRQKVAEAGLISMDEYGAKVMKGEA